VPEIDLVFLWEDGAGMEDELVGFIQVNCDSTVPTRRSNILNIMEIHKLFLWF
jgi:hypothetical protein